MESLLYHLIRAWCAPSILTFLTSHYSGAAGGGEAFLPCQHHTWEAVSIEGAAPRWAPPAPRGAQPPQSIPEHPHPCNAFSRLWGSGAGRGIVRHKWFSLLLEGSTLPCPVPGTRHAGDIGATCPGKPGPENHQRAACTLVL